MGRKYVIFGIISVFICFSNGYSQENTATVFDLKGNVKVVPTGSSMGLKCAKGMVLNAGDWVKTGPGSYVTLSFDKKDGNIVKVEENSIVILKLDGYFKIQLLRGEINAILEDVGNNEDFRVLTPSVVTESMNSGWGASSDGYCTNVIVYDNKVLVCGIDESGELKEKRYWIEEGYQRKTLKFEDPGKMQIIPEKMLSWLKEQVVAHHLAEMKEQGEGRTDTSNVLEGQKLPLSSNGTNDKKNKYTAGSGRIDLLEYLYKQRLKQ